VKRVKVDDLNLGVRISYSIICWRTQANGRAIQRRWKAFGVWAKLKRDTEAKIAAYRLKVAAKESGGAQGSA
jgi:hypothetical protein